MDNADTGWKCIRKGNSKARSASLHALSTALQSKSYHARPKYSLTLVCFLFTLLANGVLGSVNQESNDITRTKDSLKRASQLITNLLDCINQQVIPPKCPDNKPCPDNHVQGCLKDNVLGDLGSVVSQAYDALVDNERLMNENYRLTLEYEKVIKEKNVLVDDQQSQIANLTQDKEKLADELQSHQVQLEDHQSKLETCQNETEISNDELSRQKNKLIKLQAEHIQLNTQLNTTSTKMASHLFQAIDQKDSGMIELLVDLGADVNSKNNASETPLHRASLSNDKSFAVKTNHLLIEHGADIYPKDEEDYTFLHRLLDDVNGTEFTLTPAQFHEFASYLVSKNASNLFNVPGSFKKTVKPRGSVIYYNYSTPFHLAVKNLEIQNSTLSILKNNRVNFNALNEYGNSALFYAILGGRSTRLLSDLIAHGADPRHLNSYNFTLLHWASSSVGTVEQMKLFLDLGLDVNAVDSGGWTPLHAAAIRGYEDILGKVQFLLENKAKVDAKDSDGRTPLDLALSRKKFTDKDKVIKLLRDGP